MATYLERVISAKRDDAVTYIHFKFRFSSEVAADIVQNAAIKLARKELNGTLPTDCNLTAYFKTACIREAINYYRGKKWANEAELNLLQDQGFDPSIDPDYDQLHGGDSDMVSYIRSRITEHDQVVLQELAAGERAMRAIGRCGVTKTSAYRARTRIRAIALDYLWKYRQDILSNNLREELAAIGTGSV